MPVFGVVAAAGRVGVSVGLGVPEARTGALSGFPGIGFPGAPVGAAGAAAFAGVLAWGPTPDPEGFD
jgi:hypothetical protein